MMMMNFQFSGGGNRSTWRKPPTCGKYNCMHDETFHTYGLCPVRGLNLGRSGEILKVTLLIFSKENIHVSQHYQIF